MQFWAGELLSIVQDCALFLTEIVSGHPLYVQHVGTMHSLVIIYCGSIQCYRDGCIPLRFIDNWTLLWFYKFMILSNNVLVASCHILISANWGLACCCCWPSAHIQAILIYQVMPYLTKMLCYVSDFYWHNHRLN